MPTIPMPCGIPSSYSKIRAIHAKAMRDQREGYAPHPGAASGSSPFQHPAGPLCQELGGCPRRLRGLSYRRRPVPMPVPFLVHRAFTLGPVVRLGWGAFSACCLVTTAAGLAGPRSIPLGRLLPVCRLPRRMPPAPTRGCRGRPDCGSLRRPRPWCAPHPVSRPRTTIPEPTPAPPRPSVLPVTLGRYSTWLPWVGWGAILTK